MRAIRAGQFYSSAGVELDDFAFDAASKTLSLKIQPRARILEGGTKIEEL